MGMTVKERWVHLLNQSIEELSNRTLSQEIRRVTNLSRETITKKIEQNGTITAKEINDIVSKNAINTKILEKVATNTYLTSQVNLMIFSTRISALKYGGIINSIISKSPKKTAKNINFISNQILLGTNQVSKVNLQFGYVRLKEIVTKQEFKAIQNLVKSYNEEIQKGSKTTIKTELKKISKKLKKKGLNLSDFDVKKAKDIDDKKLIQLEKKKFNKKTLKQIKNISGNDIHNHLEKTKLDLAKKEKYIYKMWITQGDDKVRPSHKEVNNTKIKLDQFFKVGNSKGLYPQDRENLNIKEWINCRCYLKYYK